jgi:predicted dehydrogenase
MTINIGIVGAGNISARYMKGLQNFPGLSVKYIADIDHGRAAALAAEFSVPGSGGAEDLLADESIDVVINLTPPNLHASTVIQALEAGKSVYVEKPLATNREDALLMLKAERENPGILGSAPDTFLGSAGQTARHAIDAGLIGTPIGASAFVRSSRAETWHPNPGFLFEQGGGPVMDMGPYYIAALVNCLGPIRRVSAEARIGSPTRTVTAPDRVVDEVPVSVNTHASAVFSFESGAVGTILMSFDVWDTTLPRIEIYGTEGTLGLNDPNTFDGDVRLKRREHSEWQVLEPVTPLFGAVGTPEQHRRGLGVNDLAGALAGQPHRANSAFAFHVLDAMLAIDESAAAGQAIVLESRADRPAPVFQS